MKKTQTLLCKKYFSKNKNVKLHLSNNIQKILNKGTYYNYDTINNNNLKCVYQSNDVFECRNCDDDTNNMKISGLKIVLLIYRSI